MKDSSWFKRCAMLMHRHRCIDSNTLTPIHIRVKVATKKGSAAMEVQAKRAAGEPTAAELADVFSRAAKVLARKFDERLEGSGTSLPRSRVLVEVTRLGPIRVTDVAAAVGIAQGTASTLLEALVRDGLVVRSEDSADRRVTKMHATPEGAQQATAWLQAYEAAADDLFAQLPQSRWPEFVEILNVLGGED